MEEGRAKRILVGIEKSARGAMDRLGLTDEDLAKIPPTRSFDEFKAQLDKIVGSKQKVGDEDEQASQAAQTT